MPFAIPRTKAVLPAPRPPYMATTLPSGRSFANCSPMRSVSASLRLIYVCTGLTSFLNFF